MVNVCDRAVMKPLLEDHGFHFSKAKGQNFLIAPWVPQSIAEQAGVDESAGVLEIGPGIGPLTQQGFHFSKAKGQNFLIAPWVPQSIAEQAGVDESAGVLEIGPGIGPLTQQLCLRAKKVCAVELDTRLKPILEITVGEFDNLEILWTDVLKVNVQELVAEKFAGLRPMACANLRAKKVCAVELDTRLKPILDITVGEFDNLEILWTDVLKVNVQELVAEKFAGLRPMACANLPYYITSPILSALLEADCFDSVTVMVQKEVAQRIAAAPGSGEYGAFSVFCQYYAQPELLFDVPAGCFVPQPKVTSAVIQLKVRQERSWGASDFSVFCQYYAQPELLFDVPAGCFVPQPKVTSAVIQLKVRQERSWGASDEKLFFRTVKASFAMRRKKLANGLAAGFPELGKTGAAQVLEAAGLSPDVRGETLGIPEFVAIANQIAARREDAGFPELGKTGAAQVLEAAGLSPDVRGETLGIPEFVAIANQIAARREEKEEAL